MSEPRSFQMLMDAYIRGNAWAHENGLNAEGLAKAAYDYADKETGLGTALDLIANQAAHVRLGMAIGKVDVRDATLELLSMIDAYVDSGIEE